MPVKIKSHPSIYCLGCSYSLEGNRSNRCPECGHEFNLNDSNTFTRQPRLKLLRRWFVRFSFSFVFSVMLLGITLLVVHLAYPPYVERKFARVLESLEAEYKVKIEQSRCLGEQSEKILVMPILCSRTTDNYPFQQTDSKANSFYSSSYWHGYWFNYTKIITLDDQQMIAYWSIRENRWHVGQFYWPARNNLVWKCICETCPPNSNSTKLFTLTRR